MVDPNPDILGYIGTWLEVQDESIFKGATKISTLIKEIVYPVGSIYISVNDVNPSTFFGGTWVQLEDTFLYATSTTADANSTTATDGEATHTLTVDEMPSHTHTQNAHSHTIGSLARYSANGTASASVGDGLGNTNNYKTGNTTATNQNTGGGQAHNNMPPYMKVFMWKRTG